MLTALIQREHRIAWLRDAQAVLILAACGVLAFQCMSISIWEGWDKLFE